MAAVPGPVATVGLDQAPPREPAVAVGAELCQDLDLAVAVVVAQAVRLQLLTADRVPVAVVAAELLAAAPEQGQDQDLVLAQARALDQHQGQVRVPAHLSWNRVRGIR